MAEAQHAERSGRRTVAAILLGAAAVVTYFALGMPGMDHSGSSMAGMDHTTMTTPVGLGPAAFAERLAARDAFVVNVHVPAGEPISGTDASIPYDRIVDDPGLPASKTTSIVLYCRTGEMAITAGRALMAAGYLDVSYLKGGTRAWKQSGLAGTSR